jgi:LuxR family transcriptional regulator, maltose regulon positive regulatory protein
VPTSGTVVLVADHEGGAAPGAVAPGERGLLATKLRAPRRRDLVPRPRLLHQLAGAVDHALTVLSAPAGWGKTSLVAEWQRTSADPAVAWVSLDPQDDDPTRFWAYALAALRTVRPGLGERAGRALGPATRPCSRPCSHR